MTFKRFERAPEFEDADFAHDESFIAIPNGTVVEMDDALQLDFVWQDGEIFPVSPAMGKALREQRSRESID